MDALREAIGNSLCHRNLANPKGNEVAIFKDRVEIYNPGFFPDGVNPEDFFSGHEHSILRNPLVADTMYKSKDIERWGSGIKRIHDECASAGVKVEFRRLKTGFVVMFYRPKWEEGEGLGKGSQAGGEKSAQESTQKCTQKCTQKILEIISQNSAVTRAELAQATGLSDGGVKKQLKQLQDKGVLKRVGPDKGGHWEVLGK